MAPAQTSEVTHADSRHPIATWLALAAGAVLTVWALIELWRLGQPLPRPDQVCPAVYPHPPGCADRRTEATIAAVAVVGTYALTIWAILTLGRRRPVVTALGLGAVTVVALFGYRITLYGSLFLG